MEPKLSLNRTDAILHDKHPCNGSAWNAAGGGAAVGSLLLCVFVGSLSVLITCGNLLVIVSVMYFKQLHTPTNYLILSLAMADLLVGVIVLPLSTLLSVSACWPLADVLCRVRGAFDVFLCTSSILNLCFISVDRYYVVCQPLMYQTRMSVRLTAFMILVSWAAPALLGVGVTVRGLSQTLSGARCNIFQNTKSAIVGTFFGFYVPAVVILSLYVKILTVALRQARSVQTTAKGGGAVSKVEAKATKTLAIVVGIFLSCWAPYFLCMSFYPLSRNSIPVPLIEAFKWFGWSNSMLNPFVYAFFYKWFRSAFRMIVTGKLFQGDFTNSKLFDM